MFSFIDVYSRRIRKEYDSQYNGKGKDKDKDKNLNVNMNMNTDKTKAHTKLEKVHSDRDAFYSLCETTQMYRRTYNNQDFITPTPTPTIPNECFRMYYKKMYGDDTDTTR